MPSRPASIIPMFGVNVPNNIAPKDVEEEFSGPK